MIMNKIATLKSELAQFELDLTNCLTIDERQALITNHPANKHGFGFGEEIKLLLILKRLEVEFEIASKKPKIKELALLMAAVKSEIFWKRKRRNV